MIGLSLTNKTLRKNLIEQLSKNRVCQKRPVINVETLQIFNSLKECAKNYNTVPQNIFRQIAYNGIRYEQDCFKYKRRFEYLDVYLRDYSNKEKRKLCLYENVDFM